MTAKFQFMKAFALILQVMLLVSREFDEQIMIDSIVMPIDKGFGYISSLARQFLAVANL